jgi:transglutaminase-like putative cysteine protease
MSPVEREQRRGADLGLTLAVFFAMVAAFLPLLSVIRSGVWLVGAMLVTLLILGAGYGARRYRLPAVAVSLIEAVVWAVFMTAVFFRDTALLVFVPTPASFRLFPRLLETAMNEIELGAAPLEPTLAIGMLIVGAAGLLAIIIDHVVLTARMPLLAGVGLIAVSLIPAIIVSREADVMAFVLLAAAILVLMRVETRSRARLAEPTASPPPGTPGGVTATALGIGAIGVVVALIATPLLPEPTRAGSGGFGAGPGIDATLALGDDLRRPAEIEVLRVRTDAGSPPYLRATTLTTFDGAEWKPDAVRTIPLDSEVGLGELEVDDDIKVVEYTTSIEVKNLSSPWLPIAFPAVAVNGLEGEWAAAPYNRTVLTRTSNAQGQTYDVVTRVPRPTREQIREHEAFEQDLRDETTELPEDLPPIVGELAAEVTAGTTNDYDALIALQRWFRGIEFSYSLDAPVDEDFDGTGAQAIAKFLEVREGYCIHFAAAFALMARTLDMPSRIVVGYLPGVNSNEAIETQSLYTVSSALLHAWPEVYFEGIGWVGFEPTNSLGVATNFASAADPSSVTGGLEPTPQPTSTSSTGPSIDPDDPRANDAQWDAESVDRRNNPLPALTVAFLVLAVLAVPGVLGVARRRRLLGAAGEGDAAAAWMIVQNTAIDLGIPVPPSDSPRTLGARLIAVHGASHREMVVLIEAIERASYSAHGRLDFWQGDELATAATTVSASLMQAVETPRRMLALVAPRSLVVRPGTAYAGAGLAMARARR